MFADHQPARPKEASQYRNGTVGIAMSAHENVDGREPAFRPRVDADVRFGQDNDAGKTTAAKPVEMGMEDRCSGSPRGFA
jgi:hypothetical protein